MRLFPVTKRDPRARALADRHYSRQKVGSREIGPPGQKLIYMTVDGRCLWGSHRPAPWAGIDRADGFMGHSCFIFRNEGPLLSSELIVEAVGLTAKVWGVAPFITYVAKDHVESPNPGYCFLVAGFEHNGWVESGKLGTLRRLIMKAGAVAEATKQGQLS